MRPPESWRTARVTLAIAGVTAIAWLLVSTIGLQEAAVNWGGFIPARVSGMTGDEILAPVWLTPLTMTLVHGGFVHLAFNLLILLFCGRSVESIIGGRGLLILYAVGAYGAALGHWAFPVDPVVPAVGASGAISAVLGAYALLFGRNRVRVVDPRLALWLHVLWLLAAWIALQALIGFALNVVNERSVTDGPALARVAIGAHIGGFVVGLLLVKPLLLWRYRKA